MSVKMQVTLRQQQRLAMTQQLRQAITLLQYSTLELQQLVRQQMELNPFLEEDEVTLNESLTFIEPTQLTAAIADKQHALGRDEGMENYAKPVTLHEHLRGQTLLCQFDEIHQAVAEYVVDAINEQGFLLQTAEEIQLGLAPDIHVSVAAIQGVIATIRGFDPIGVAAHDVRECLLLQLLYAESKWGATPAEKKVLQMAQRIVEAHLDDSDILHPKKMAVKLKVSEARYLAGFSLIRTLNRAPGDRFTDPLSHGMTPELYVKKIAGVWRVFLANNASSRVKVNKQYQEMVKQQRACHANEALHASMEEARAFVSGLMRRNETLLAVATAIVMAQKAFFDSGAHGMKPMNMSEIAAELNIHESTVSRVTTGKYIATPAGVFELKYFFPSRLSGGLGETSSAIAARTLIRSITAKETAACVYSDGQIASLLKAQGIHLSRRTVAKYRDNMRIASANLRRLRLGGVINK